VDNLERFTAFYSFVLTITISCYEGFECGRHCSFYPYF